jgi:hypothetical protein
MKQIIRLGKVAITIVGLSGIVGLQNSYSMSSLGLSCPEKYIATVTNVEDVALSEFPKIEVDFQIIQTLKGDKIQTKKMQIVKGGPVEFKSGEIYTLEARDQWLCSASAFSKI